jgi:hypothetical protein
MYTRGLLWILILSATPPVFADSMRCGKWVVNEQTTPVEILEKCGEPKNRQISSEDVLGKNALGNPIKLGVKITERWYYQASSRSLPMVVTLVDGKVRDIQRAEP